MIPPVLKKIIPGSARFQTSLFLEFGGTAFVLTAVLIISCAGCTKKTPASETSNSQVTTQVQSFASNPAVDFQPATITTNAAPDLRALNRKLIQCVIAARHGFKTIDEFAAAANIQIPTPPPGKKYAFDKHGYIVLVNQ